MWITHLRVFIRPTANFQKVDPAFNEELNLPHRVFKLCRVVVRRVELDSDAEVRGHGLADLPDDVHDDLCSLLGGSAVVIGAQIGLSKLVLLKVRKI